MKGKMIGVLYILIIFSLYACSSDLSNISENEEDNGAVINTEQNWVDLELEVDDEEEITSPPELKMFCQDKMIPYVMGINEWDGVIHDRESALESLVKQKETAIPYLPLGKKINIVFEDGIIPDQYKFYDLIINSDGSEKYKKEITLQKDLSFFKDTAEFILEKNYGTALSSDTWTYEKGGVIRGFRLICSWDDNECEYGFIIRTDEKEEAKQIHGEVPPIIITSDLKLIPNKGLLLRQENENIEKREILKYLSRYHIVELKAGEKIEFEWLKENMPHEIRLYEMRLTNDAEDFEILSEEEITNLTIEHKIGSFKLENVLETAEIAETDDDHKEGKRVFNLYCQWNNKEYSYFFMLDQKMDGIIKR